MLLLLRSRGIPGGRLHHRVYELDCVVRGESEKLRRTREYEWIWLRGVVWHHMMLKRRQYERCFVRQSGGVSWCVGARLHLVTPPAWCGPGILLLYYWSCYRHRRQLYRLIFLPVPSQTSVALNTNCAVVHTNMGIAQSICFPVQNHTKFESKSYRNPWNMKSSSKLEIDLLIALTSEFVWGVKGLAG